MDKKENDDYNSLDSPQENDVSFFSDLKSALGMKDVDCQVKLTHFFI